MGARDDGTRLLEFAQRITVARTHDEILCQVRNEVEARCGYQNAWLYLRPSSTDAKAPWRLFAVSGAIHDQVSHLTLLDHEGDAMLQEIAAAVGPVVVHDARADPRTNKALVAELGNRTIINIPIRLVDRGLGAFGTGTFAPEEPRSPTPDELEYLQGMALVLAGAVGRLCFEEEEQRRAREREEVAEQMRESQRLESLGMFAAGIAHDFNNLLTTIVLNLALCRQAIGPSSPGSPRLDDIAEATAEAVALARQMLAYAGQGPHALQPVDVRSVVLGTESLLRAIVPRNIELTLPEPGPSDVVLGDPTQIRQVVLNLVTNAAEAIELGVGRIRIELDRVQAARSEPQAFEGARELEDGAYVRLRVVDDGPGMDPDTRRRVFDPFFSTKKLGRGLGMASVMGIVKAHRGAAEVRSAPGDGTSIAIWLPVGADAIEAQPAGAADAGGGSLAGTRVFVIEDDPSVSAATSRVLQAAGVEVRVSADRDEAVGAVEASSGRFDVVVLDLTMPGLGTHETLRRLRAAAPKLPILLTSGYSASDVSELVRGDAAIEFLAKPYGGEELVAKLRDVISRRGAG